MASLLPLPAAAQLVKPQVMILLDNSGSMRRTAANAMAGNDCFGPNPVDLCGDGLCSGAERNAAGHCLGDCPIDQDSNTAPGSAPKCGYPTKDFVLQPSRLAMVKRSLRNIIPDLRTNALVGLAGFNHQVDGAPNGEYFQYHQAASGATQKVTLLLTEWELRAGGAWTQGAGWDATNDAPAETFEAHGTPYALLSQPAVQADPNISVDADSLYRRLDGTNYQYARFKWADAGRDYDDGTYQWTYVGSYYAYDAEGILSGTTAVAEFKGPRYVDGGQVWIYRRFDGLWGNHGLVYQGGGRIFLPFAPDSDQSVQDDQVARLLTWVNMAGAGGFYGVGVTGGTPTGETFQLLTQMFDQLAASDAWGYCRNRFVLLLSDGASTGINPVPEAQALYDLDTGNRIKTYVVAIPGTPGGAMLELDSIAAAGGTVAAVSTNDEAELVEAIHQAIMLGQGELGTCVAPPDAGPGVDFTVGLDGGVGPPLDSATGDTAFAVDGGVIVDGAVFDAAPDGGRDAVLADASPADGANPVDGVGPVDGAGMDSVPGDGAANDAGLTDGMKDGTGESSPDGASPDGNPDGYAPDSALDSALAADGPFDATNADDGASGSDQGADDGASGSDQGADDGASGSDQGAEGGASGSDQGVDGQATGGDQKGDGSGVPGPGDEGCDCQLGARPTPPGGVFLLLGLFFGWCCRRRPRG